MAEEKKTVEEKYTGFKSFKLGGEKVEWQQPKGKRGVQAVNYVMNKLGRFIGSDDEGAEAFSVVGEMLADDWFWSTGLPALLGVTAEELENITYVESLNAVLGASFASMAGLGEDEADEALKN